MLALGLVMTTVAVTFLTAPDFWMRGPTIKASTGRREGDRLGLTGRKVYRRRGAKFSAIRQVHLNPNAL